jgi:hypothetical protein
MLRDLLRGEGMAIGRGHVVTLMKRMGIDSGNAHRLATARHASGTHTSLSH